MENGLEQRRGHAAGAQIGRFEIQRELGHGTQGRVYLAHDTRLDRLVALKSLRLAQNAARPEQLRLLMDEARIVSRLQHPNIVALHDVIEEAGEPYLVFEYVEGRTLAQTLKQQGALPPAQAVRLMLEILRGVKAAHAQGIAHRDLKPANIMLTSGGVARVMDFGVALKIEAGALPQNELSGTPAYMAPEYIEGGIYTTRCDLFSLGMILYELVSGSAAVSDSDYRVVLRRISAGDYPRAAQRNAAVDERLDALIMKALAVDPSYRFASAAEMSAALQAYLDPAEQRDEADEVKRGKQATLEFLLRRMRHGSDFPALTATISSVNQALSGENDKASVLCNAILKDFALTNKLLKLVNAVYFNQFGGHVSTISRAVAIMGFDGVRNVALSLVLLEHLQNKAQAAALKDEVTATYFCGIVARQLVARLGVPDAEHAFICAMFHRLGKLLAVFYLHEEAQAVDRLREARGLDEARASSQVLGLSYEELGIGVAREWKFPDLIVDSMRQVHEPLHNRHAFARDSMRTLAALSNDLCEIVARTPEKERNLKIAEVIDKFQCGVDVNDKLLRGVITESAKEVARESAMLGMSLGKSRFLLAARETGGEQTRPEVEDDIINTLVAATALNLNTPPQTARDEAAAHRSGVANTPEMRRTVLAAGVQDITNTLVGEYRLNDVLQIILETMYRAIGFKRVMLLIRDVTANALRARFGFGEQVDAIIKQGFTVPLNGPRDIFFASISQGADLCIEDLNVEKIRAHVPQWFRDLIDVRGMVLFPILVNRRPVALIYADADADDILHFQPEELNLLKTLRNQAILAIKQQS